MACSLLTCCRLFNDNLKNMPHSEEYIKKKLCFGDYSLCKRFQFFQEFGENDSPASLYPYDTEELKKMLQCLQKKRDSEDDSE